MSIIGSLSVTKWDPLAYTGARRQAGPIWRGQTYAALILNQPIEDKDWFLDICMNAVLRVCADGGANRVRDLALVGDEAKAAKPDIICGDCDSIRDDVMNYYAAGGTLLIKDPDQYSTDVTKSLKAIQDWASKVEVCPLHVVVLGGMGGRFDQGFSQIQHLYTATQDESLLSGRIYLVNPESVCFLLSKGRNEIRTPCFTGGFGPNVGIIPIGRPATVSTKGLEWDVTDWYTEFGGQLSTSNHIQKDIVEVETSEMVLFTMEIDRGVSAVAKTEGPRGKENKVHGMDGAGGLRKEQDSRVSQASDAAAKGRDRHAQSHLR